MTEQQNQAEQPEPMSRDQIVEQLRADSMAVALKVKRFGKRKAMTTDQVGRAAGEFGADPDYVSGSKRLLNDRHELYRAVSGILSQARTTWVDMTLPYPDSGKRLMRRASLPEFQRRMGDHVGALQEAVTKLDEVYRADLIREAEQRLGELHNPADYPASLDGAFQIEWEFPSVEPPGYLQEMSPELYDAERRRIQARFDEAITLAEQMFTAELAGLVELIRDQVSDRDVAEWRYEGPTQMELAKLAKQNAAELEQVTSDLDTKSAEAAGCLDEMRDKIAQDIRAIEERHDRLQIESIRIADRQKLTGARDIEQRDGTITWRTEQGGNKRDRTAFQDYETAVQWLRDRGCVQGGVRQEQRRLRQSSLDRLSTFLDRFQNMSVRSSAELDAAVAAVREAATGIEVKAVNEGDQAAQTRERLRQTMQSVAESLDTVTVGTGQRKIDFDEEP